LGQNPFPEWQSQRKEKKMARFGTSPAISGEAMAEIDRIMMRDLGVDTLQLMELAGYGVADAVRRHAGLDIKKRPMILALAGTGGNGGDAMVAARLLSAWGTDATVILVKPRSGYTGIAAHQMAILDRMDIPVLEPDTVTSLPAADLIIDGLLGFSLKGDPRGEAERLICIANDHPAPVVAIDLPSGLDATSGHVGEPCIRAAMTVTLALPKTGLLSAAVEITGAIWLADIGVPPHLYAHMDVTVPPDIFSDDGLVPL
jgi:NAD(P)H-hydrate epimerase